MAYLKEQLIIMIQIIANTLDYLAAKNRIILSIALFGIIFLVFYFVIFPNLNIGGQALLDAQFSYSPEKAYEIIQAYPPQGRKVYAIVALTLDVIAPIIYSLFLGVILTGLLRSLGLSETIWYCFRFFPFIVGFADILENINISILLLQYPQKIEIIARLASLLTSTKWILFGVNVASIFILLFIAVPRWFQK